MADSRDHDDAELLARMARGDDVAFETIYRRYLPAVLRWLLATTGSREAAADLSAEVFAAALIAARRYRPDRGPVVAWLLGIARNKQLESQRRGRIENAARRRLGLAPVALEDADLERVVELASVDERIMASFASLPEDQRTALLSRVVEERSYGEIASELRCSESVIRQRVSRGLKTLRANTERE
jgi:RNA polymerase sigma factor (sigma-70 family)